MEGGFSSFRTSEQAPTKERPGFFERTELLRSFRPTDPERCLAEVRAQREQAVQPERSLWDATELMMRDEILRDRLLKLKTVSEKPGPEDEHRRELHGEYRSLVAGYRALVEMVDQSGDRTLREQKIIPHTSLGDVRLRLADLLANIGFYFPEQKVSDEDKTEALRRLSEAYYGSVQEGVQAEIALVGLLRYGPEWLRGGLSGKGHLSPTMFVERTMPREDVLRTQAGGVQAGQFNGYDLLYRLPDERSVRFLQLKTRNAPRKIFHATLPALELMKACDAVFGAHSIRQELTHPEIPGVLDQSAYHNVVHQVIEEFPLDIAARHSLKRLLLPRRVGIRESFSSPPAWVVSWRDVKHMLETNSAFRRFAQMRGMPLVAREQDFRRWSDLLVQARASHPQEAFWREWPPGRGKRVHTKSLQN